METTRRERRLRRAVEKELASPDARQKLIDAMPVKVAQATSARHGWPLEVLAGAADDPAIERPAAFLAALRRALGDR